MINLATIIAGLKLAILAAILFVWFVRYDNIIKEFKEYNYPNWLRDFVGILKVTFAFMLQSQNSSLVRVGCLGLALLMAAAFVTHIKVKHTPDKMLPSFTLMVFSIFILLNT